MAEITEQRRQEIVDHIKKEWYGDGFPDGFFLRDDGRVEILSPNESNPVKGYFYDECKIVNQDEAWCVIYASNVFQDTLRKAIEKEQSK